MRITLAFVLTLLVMLSFPALLFAKGDIVRITIKGADLKTPVEITDPKVLANFGVWTGPEQVPATLASIPTSLVSLLTGLKVHV